MIVRVPAIVPSGPPHRSTGLGRTNGRLRSRRADEDLEWEHRECFRDDQINRSGKPQQRRMALRRC